MWTRKLDSLNNQVYEQPTSKHTKLQTEMVFVSLFNNKLQVTTYKQFPHQHGCYFACYLLFCLCFLLIDRVDSKQQLQLQ